ncbi:hypothetical protein RBU55_00990 [Pseudomonas chlororaphis subsp. aurantiaca]|uniref:hypothetical protein n=1 Tax=Pseudomonas chlororaphis TaxID=587753 RepID=UPI0027DCDC83|nr:hypothetical protein [Pseudomonas chlororaphis]WMJ00160.1 hypothetical protein RBU55_00990 [Pseudomonas chlororaphis subsp. aurantiaca]
MKRALFRNLETQARFQLDSQWWVKVDVGAAKHATYDFSIDMSPSSTVLVRGVEDTPSSKTTDNSRKQMRKREGFLLLLATWLESLNW